MEENRPCQGVDGGGGEGIGSGQSRESVERGQVAKESESFVLSYTVGGMVGGGGWCEGVTY